MGIVLGILLLIGINVVIALIKSGAKAGYNKMTEPSDSLKKVERDADQVSQHYRMSEEDASAYKDIQRFGTSFARFAFLVASADGEVDDSEIGAIFEFLGGSGADPTYLKGVYDSIQKDARNASAIDWDYTFKITKALFERSALQDYDTILLDGLLRVSAADGNIDDEELEMIGTIMARLGWDPQKTAEFIQFRFAIPDDMSTTQSRSWALESLGLEDSATESEVKAAYRRLAKQYHPDMIGHLGASLRQSAIERFHEIQAAYELLTKKAASI